MKRQAAVFVLLGVMFFTREALSFCGFYVAKADAKLFNKASQVVIARDGNRTVLTMANDFQGDVKDFALVVPVPVVLKEDQVNVGDPKIVKRLDSFSAPRLVEYFDEDPCRPVKYHKKGEMMMDGAGKVPTAPQSSKSLGVTVEAAFTVGEYDIVILSAKESAGLETWLIQNKYKIPKGAKELLKPYIKQKMKFFVAKVNLKELEKTGFEYLRPIMMAFESPKFMLPIRLGMLNARSAQDLVVFVLSPKGRAEVTNYRTVNIPTDQYIPLYLREPKEFAKFYRAMFSASYKREGRNAVFLEHAWDMAWCDPCADNPLTKEELEKAGVFWTNGSSAPNVYITRLHVRYTRKKFPEDLSFQETSNRENFQGRYILRQPFKGNLDCKAGQQYLKSLQERFQQEAQTLARLTGWEIETIWKKMKLTTKKISSESAWWKKIFKK